MMTIKTTFKLLVAVKDKAIVEQVKETFDHCDCHIIPAPSMSLALFLTQKNLPDAILADFELTDGDGLQFLREVKTESELAAIPFIFYVDESKPDKPFDRNEAIKQGAMTMIDSKIRDTALYDLVMPIVKKRIAEKEERPEETPE